MKARNLRIVFMGTPEFAVESLKALVENGYNVVGVITAPDKPAGRGLKVFEPAVKQYARLRNGQAVEAGLIVLQPEKLKNPDFLAQLESLKPDLQIVVAFRMLPEAVWTMPPLGTFNLHASLLPQYRGAAPLNWAIINGETWTGLTTFLLTREIDTGNIILQEKEPIGSGDTVGDLHDRLMVKGAAMVMKTVDLLASGHFQPVSQDTLVSDHSDLKPAPKLSRETIRIDWNKPADRIRNLIRGLSPYPAAWTTLRNTSNGLETELKVFYAETEIIFHGNIPGTITSDGRKYLKIACPDGWIKITDLQLAGKKRMKIEEFLRGFQHLESYIII
jgi:methionyl-tRNA formyltransferase